jgi:WD40 repeat protein
MKVPAPDTLKLVKEHGRQPITFALARVPGTGRVFLGSSDFAVSEGDLSAAKFEAKELYKHDSYVTSVALAGKVLVSGGYDGKLVWWDTERKQKLRTTDAHAKWVRRVVTSPDGNVVASVADDMVAKLWDAADGQLVRELKGHAEKTPQHFGSMLYAVAFSADGKHLATGDKVGHVVVWETETGKKVAELDAPVMYTWDVKQRLHSIGGIRSLAFSPDGKQLAVGGMGKVGNIDHLEGKARVEVFDWQAGKQTAEFPGDKFSGLVNQLRWAPDGSWLLGAGGGAEGFLLFFDATAKKVLKQEKAPAFVHEAVLSDNAASLVTAGHNKVCVYALG